MTGVAAERKRVLSTVRARRRLRADPVALFAARGGGAWPDSNEANQAHEPPLILVVEDDDPLALVMDEWLRSLGYGVWRTSGVEETKALLPTRRPSLILLDLILPDGDGLALCADLKAHPSSANVPVIVCSGTSRARDAILSLKLGADYFLTKPFSFPELQVRIETLLRDRRARGARLGAGGQAGRPRSTRRGSSGQPEHNLGSTNIRLAGGIVVEAWLSDGRVLNGASSRLSGTAGRAGCTTPKDTMMAAGRARVLVIDDNESIRALVTTVLELKGFEPQTAPNGARALEMLRQPAGGSPPDVILVDMAMPVMDGPAFVEAYRRLAGPHAPIVGVTATPWLAAPIAHDLEGVLVKPFRIAELVELLNRVLATRSKAAVGQATARASAQNPAARPV